ncbi:MAG TPA: hypothetical protein VFZ77_02560, partial [Acidimicrobiales bacterium]
PIVRATGGDRAGASSDDAVPAARALWLAAVAVAVVDPVRVRRLAGPHPRSVATGGSVAAALAIFGVAAAAGPLLRAADVSPATALVAAGIVLVLTAVVDAVRRPPAPWPPGGPGGGWLVPLALPALVRPAVAAMAVAVAAHWGLAVGAAVAVGVAVAGLAVLPAEGRPAGGRAGRPGLADVAHWAFVAVAVLGGIDLAVHGVFAV